MALGETFPNFDASQRSHHNIAPRAVAPDTIHTS